MKIRAQIGMVLNLDKCIGCHTCSVTCKNVWTNREGMEYAWFNNVETKPGIGYPEGLGEPGASWNGGWVRKGNGKIEPKQGGKLAILAKIFANPNLPEIDDYYEPFTFDYEHLHTAPEMKAPPVARPRSLITGAAHGEDRVGPELGGDPRRRVRQALARTPTSRTSQKDIYGQFENTFMMYLPRLCEHCLNPTCVASCPSGSIYKREEDGIVLIDQDKCRGWRMCVSGCPYKKIYYNWRPARPRSASSAIRASRPASRRCARRPASGASAISACCSTTPTASRRPRASRTRRTSTRRSSTLFLDPNDPAVIAAGARATACPRPGSRRRRRSPVYKMAMDWKVALPLHPEYRTLPMVWYVPPLSPIQRRGQRRPDRRVRRAARRALRCASRCVPRQPADRRRRGAGGRGAGAHAGDARLHARPPRRAGARTPRAEAGRADRARRSRRCTATWRSPTTRTASSSRPRTASTPRTPSTLRGGCGFTFGNGCSDGQSEASLFGGKKTQDHPDQGEGRRREEHDHDDHLQGAVRAARLPVERTWSPRCRRSRRSSSASRGSPRRDTGRAARAARASSARADLLDAAGALRRRCSTAAARLAAPVRARARRFARARPGDGGPEGDLRRARLRAAPATSCPTSCRRCSNILSQRPAPRRRTCCGDCAHILRAVGEALQDRGSRYAAVFAALLATGRASRACRAAARDKPAGEGEADRRGVGRRAGDLRSRRRAGCGAAAPQPP